ncbi:unnamed protein product, partial [Symbiodinium sp. CCMP2456]
VDAGVSSLSAVNFYEVPRRHLQPEANNMRNTSSESELAAMPKFSLYARLRAAGEEAGKDRLRARLVWLLVVLETISMLCFPQVATLTHGAFFLIPLGALLLAAAVRLYPRPGILLAEPLCVVWPDNHSRHGLAREQAPNLCFGGFVWVLKLVCCLTFWTKPDANSFLEGNCPDAVPQPSCSHYDRLNLTRACMVVHLTFETPNANRLHLLERECWDQCSSPGCGPREQTFDDSVVAALSWKFVHMHCDDPCDLSCCQCLHCHLSPTVPSWLKQGCLANAFAPDLAQELYVCHNPGCEPKPNPYYEAQTLSSENTMLAQLSRCTLVHGEEPTQVKTAVAVVAALQCLPLASLIACLLLSIWVHLLKGGSAFVMLGTVPMDPETIEAIDAKAAELKDQIAHRRLESSPKVKFQLWMDFVVFLLDYLSDYNCLRTFVVEGAYGVAAVQVVIIAAPVALDCYRGKIQLVEVFGQFIESRKRGFPTDDFMLALRSEKSLEAPLSMFLQFYMLLRTTHPSSIWSLCISMPLSILGIAKHVHATFELQVLEVLTRHPAQPSQPELQTTPLQSGHGNRPQQRPGPGPAAGPWRSGGENLAMQGSPCPPDSMPVILAFPPGIAPRAEPLPTLPPGIAPRGALLPITVGSSKAKDTE